MPNSIIQGRLPSQSTPTSATKEFQTTICTPSGSAQGREIAVGSYHAPFVGTVKMVAVARGQGIAQAGPSIPSFSTVKMVAGTKKETRQVSHTQHTDDPPDLQYHALQKLNGDRSQLIVAAATSLSLIPELLRPGDALAMHMQTPRPSGSSHRRKLLASCWQVSLPLQEEQYSDQMAGISSKDGNRFAPSRPKEMCRGVGDVQADAPAVADAHCVRLDSDRSNTIITTSPPRERRGQSITMPRKPVAGRRLRRFVVHTGLPKLSRRRTPAPSKRTLLLSPQSMLTQLGRQEFAML